VATRVLDTGKGFKGQQEALRVLAQLVEKDTKNPKVITVARAIVQDCPARDDMCEVTAIFDAVKKGDPRIKGLEKGLRYVTDPRLADYFVSPSKTLELCEGGSCGGDCDEAASLQAALLGSLGFVTGLRGWGVPPRGGPRPPLSHVYTVVRIPKKNSDFNGYGGGRSRPVRLSGYGRFNEALGCEEIGLDTTVANSYPGWEPPGNNTLTAFIR
jgi:hypothetical protein